MNVIETAKAAVIAYNEKNWDRVMWKGVHTGPLQMPSGTIPATNKHIDIPACQVAKVQGGKVQSVSHYFDLVTLLTQIGAFKG